MKNWVTEMGAFRFIKVIGKKRQLDVSDSGLQVNLQKKSQEIKKSSKIKRKICGLLTGKWPCIGLSAHILQFNFKTDFC